MSETGERFTLANRNHVGLFFEILVLQGALCLKCGHGTRTTSKRWARCKECDERVPRRTMEEVEAMLKEAGTEQ